MRGAFSRFALFERQAVVVCCFGYVVRSSGCSPAFPGLSHRVGDALGCGEPDEFLLAGSAPDDVAGGFLLEFPPPVGDRPEPDKLLSCCDGFRYGVVSGFVAGLVVAVLFEQCFDLGICWFAVEVFGCPLVADFVVHCAPLSFFRRINTDPRIMSRTFSCPAFFSLATQSTISQRPMQKSGYFWHQKRTELAQGIPEHPRRPIVRNLCQNSIPH